MTERVDRGGDARNERRSPHNETDRTLLEHFEERAAIVEYDGGLSRAEAEALAWAEVTK